MSKFLSAFNYGKNEDGIVVASPKKARIDTSMRELWRKTTGMLAGALVQGNVNYQC